MITDIDWHAVAAMIRDRHGQPARLLRLTERRADLDVPGDDADLVVVADNGGEMTLQRVRIEHVASLPYSGPHTLAYRIRRLLDGEPVEWSLDLDAELKTMREEPKP